MRPYEVMIIFDSTLEEDAIRAELDRCAELIRSRGGNPGKVERWGRRRLAYEINKQRDGYYVLLEANAEPAVMDELDRTLTLADPVMRHKVVRVPEKPMIRPTRRELAGESGPPSGAPSYGAPSAPPSTSPEAPIPDLAASAADQPS
jgi:small subunit ribosomal protein S6